MAVIIYYIAGFPCFMERTGQQDGDWARQLIGPLTEWMGFFVV